MIKNYKKIVLATILIIVVITTRLMPHVANFSILMAVAVFSGAILPKKWSMFVPLIAVVISDVFIGFYDIMPIVWACYMVVAIISSSSLKKLSPVRLTVTTLSASLLFFVVTNLAVWMVSGWYDKNLSGLINCYIAALPFFRNSLLSDLLFTPALFSIYALAKNYRLLPISLISTKRARTIALAE